MSKKMQNITSDKTRQAVDNDFDDEERDVLTLPPQDVIELLRPLSQWHYQPISHSTGSA